jgi:uncharacterized protein YuzE
METLKILEKKENLQWDYDAEADVLYVSIGSPAKGEGVDLGNDTIVRINSETKEIIGFTIINPLKKTLNELNASGIADKNCLRTY